MVIYILIGFLVAVLLMVVEYFLCTKLHSSLWGGIIPILVLVCTIVVFGSGYVSLDWKAILLCIILNTLCFGDWAAGREQYRKNQQTSTNTSRIEDMHS